MRNQCLDCGGNILIEGCIIIFMVLLVFITQLELIRRIGLETFLQYSAFRSVREVMLGIPLADEDRKVNSPFTHMFPFLRDGSSGWFNHFVKINRTPTGGVVSAKYHAKYRSYIQFFEDGIKKKYFEVTEACRFPFLSH